MLFLREEPFVRQALHAIMDVKGTPKDLYRLLQTRDSRLFYILSAKGDMCIDGISYPLRPDTLILFRAGTPYEWRVEHVDYYAVNFDYSQAFCHILQSFHPVFCKNYCEELTFECGSLEDCPRLNSPIVLHKAIALKYPIQNIIAEAAIKDSWNPPILSVMLKRVILEALRSQESPQSERDPVSAVKQVAAYVQDNYIEEITNQTIAQHFGYHPTYLGRIFKAQTGMTLHSFLEDLRFQRAMELLANTALPVGQICEQVGYKDIYHFSKHFKKRNGMSPAQYRRQQNEAFPND